MNVKQQVFLYGNSVILGSIAASLQRCSQFDVTTLATPLQKAQAFDNPKPDIVLFDLEAPHTENVFFLMKTNPALLLIGINPGENIVGVWRSQQMQDISLQGLLELIKRGTIGDHDPPPCGSPDIRKIDSFMDIEADD
jgi:hypothetical protein